MNNFPHETEIKEFLEYMFEPTTPIINTLLNSVEDKDKTIAELGGLHEFMLHEGILFSYVRHLCKLVEWQDTLVDGDLLPEITAYIRSFYPYYDVIKFMLCKRKNSGSIESYCRRIFIDLVNL